MKVVALVECVASCLRNVVPPSLNADAGAGCAVPPDGEVQIIEMVGALGAVKKISRRLC